MSGQRHRCKGIFPDGTQCSVILTEEDDPDYCLIHLEMHREALLEAAQAQASLPSSAVLSVDAAPAPVSAGRPTEPQATIQAGLVMPLQTSTRVGRGNRMNRRALLDPMVRVLGKWLGIIVGGVAGNAVYEAGKEGLHRLTSKNEPSTQFPGGGERLDRQQELQALVAKLHDPDWVVRANAAGKLGALGDQRAVPVLIAILQDSTQSVRGPVAEALGKLKDQRAVPVLRAALQDRDEWVSREAAYALGRLGDRQSLPALLVALQGSGTRGMRYYTIKALEVLGDRRAVPALRALRNDSDPEIQRAIAEALKKLEEVTGE